jgi:pyrroline-5-carboxylate reductase
MKKHVAIIGCGNLGQSILKGLIAEPSFAQTRVIATKRNLKSLEAFEKQGIEITSDNAKAVNDSDLILVALKPHNILQTLNELKHSFDPQRHLIISAATGITIAQIQETIETQTTIFRAMPNIAADVRESITCICAKSPTEEDIKTVRTFFDSIGSTIIITEDLMEAATVLGACGVAYVLRFIRAMIQGGIQIGFDVDTASKIVNQTVKGAAELLIAKGQHPEFEIDKVTTPKGCTIAGLNEMEHNGFSSSLIKGILASFHKIEK